MSRKLKGAHFAESKGGWSLFGKAKKAESTDGVVQPDSVASNSEEVGRTTDAEQDAVASQPEGALVSSVPTVDDTSMSVEALAIEPSEDGENETVGEMPASSLLTIPEIPAIPEVTDPADVIDAADVKPAVAPQAEDDGSTEADEQTTVSPFVQLSAADAETGPKHGAGQEPKRRSKLPIILSLLLLVTLAGGYGAGVVAFQRYFMPNTSLGGEDVSFREIDQVAAEHGEATGDYKLSVSGEGLTLSISSADVNLRSDGEAYVREAMAGINPWIWPVQILVPHKLSAHESITLDEQKLGKLVEDAVKTQNETATMPVDAKATYDSELHSYVVTPEVPGTALDATVVTKQANDALLTLEPTLELGDDALLQPAVFQDDEALVKGVDEVNKRLSAVQTLKVGDKEVYKVESGQIASWVSVSDDLEMTVDSAAITDWARGELSEKLDSVGGTRDFTRPDGKNVRVSGGEYGWSIDGTELANQIAANIEAGTEATIDIPMLQTADVWNPGGQDWGNRYIDIDLSEQHVRMYDDSGSLIWESDCVTGNVSEGHETPQGVYQLNSNKEYGDVVLEGKIDEKTGQPEYVSHVTYWMPFVWNAIAMHDATWRYSFGGDNYYYNGSHGCVNLPYDAAEALFYLCEVGDVVVVHP